VSVTVKRRPPPRAAAGAVSVALEACADLRCGCGSLLARRVAGGVELKCRRCKRTLVVALEEDDAS
jgi:hypothetical protein